MSQLVNYLSSKSGDSCSAKAVLPVVGQSKVSITAGSGSTAIDLFPAPGSGKYPYDAGQVRNDSCADLQVAITYLVGQDCDSCTDDTLTEFIVKVIVPKNSVFPLPTGLVSAATVTTGTWNADGTFSAANVTKNSVVEWYSNYQPCCGGKVLIP